MPTYEVTVTETVTHKFTIPDCRTPEEAEAIAEGMRDDDIDGEEVNIESVETDSIEVEEGEVE